MENRASHRYAKALLELALEKGVLDEVHSDMQAFAEICKQNRDFELMLKSPVIPHYRKYNVLEAILKGKVHTVSFAIFDIITRKNREELLPEIAAAFHQQYNDYKNIQVAQVTTTFPLDDTLRNHFQKIVQEVTGKQVELHEKIDPTLIGGYLLQIGDKQADESVKNKLRKLKIELSNS
jgi:F-type H+-transporting ATPase subunit delta